MKTATLHNFSILRTSNKDTRYEAFQALINEAEQPVEWVYEVWDDLFVLLKEGDNHQRAMAAQLISALAKSDGEKRLLNDFKKLVEVTKDEKFVTARHALQSFWKIGIESDEYLDLVARELSGRFKECGDENNCTLIRYDIIEVLRKIYDTSKNEKAKSVSLKLIDLEEDDKYKKKYATLWSDLVKPSRKTSAR